MSKLTVIGELAFEQLVAHFKDLSEIIKIIEECFPLATKNENLKSFVLRRLELHLIQGCIFWHQRLVIPQKLRLNVIELIHDGHIGIVRSKQ